MKIIFAVDNPETARRWKTAALRLMHRRPTIVVETLNISRPNSADAADQLRRANADIVHFDTHNAVPHSLFIAAEASRRLLSYDSFQATLTDRQPFLSRLRRTMLRKKSIVNMADAVICKSIFEALALKDSMPDKPTVTISESALQCPPPSATSHEKDPENYYYCQCNAADTQLPTLLKAAVQLDIPLRIAVRGDCTDLAQRFGRAGNITFLSPDKSDEKDSLKARFHVIIDNDARTAQIRTVASLLAGVPVVAATAAPEINTDNGRLFHPDRPDSLADSLAAVWQKKYNRHAIAANQAALCDAQADKLLNFYSSLTSQE